MTPKMLVPEIVLRLLEEQANTISKVKLNKIGFRVLVYGFGFKKIHQGGNKNPQANIELNHASWRNWGSNTSQ